MLGIGLVDVFDNKFVNYKTESNFVCRVVPEAWRVAGQEVSKPGEILCGGSMCDLAGLGEAVHSLADLDEDVAVLDKWWEILGIDDLLGNHGDGNAHVFVPQHQGV